MNDIKTRETRVLMLHVLFSISSFIQVSNNEARKCDLNLYNNNITSVLLLRYARKVGPGLSAQTKERAVFEKEDKDGVVSR